MINTTFVQINMEWSLTGMLGEDSLALGAPYHELYPPRRE